MMHLTDWAGLSGLALVWVLLALRLPVVAKLTPIKRVLCVVAIYGVVLLPLFGLSLSGLLRGMVGDLSITSLLLLTSALWERLRYLKTLKEVVLWSERDRYSLLLMVSGFALVLYPFALGIGMFDPYRLGFASVIFIVALALLSLWAIYRGLVLLPLVIALSVLAWSQDVYESTNLWDYLIDVPLAIYAISAALRSFYTQVRRGKRVQTKSQ